MAESSRRRFLTALGSAVAAALLPGRAGAASGWREATSPTGADLRDVARARSGAVAVGGGGVVLVRSAGRWSARRTTGVAGQGRNLTAAAATDDGGTVWIAGDGGALAAYDPGADRLDDRSAPGGYTGSFTDVAVAGPAGAERVRLTDESGQVHVGARRDDGVAWSRFTPGGGATLPAVAAHCRGRAYAVDTNGRAYALHRGEATVVGESAENLYAVAADRRSRRERARRGGCGCRPTERPTDGSDAAGGDGGSGGHCDRCRRVVVAGGGGHLALYDGGQWRSASLGDATVRDLAVGPGSGYAVGDGGAVFAVEFGGDECERVGVPTDQPLRAVSRGSPVLAVGDGGTIVEN